MAVAAGLVLLPLVVVALSPWRAVTALVLLAMMPALAVSPISWRVAARAIAPIGAVAFAAMMLTASGSLLPALGTGLVVSLALWTARAAPGGTASARAVLIIIAAHLLVAPAGLLPGAASEPILVSAGTVSIVLTCSAAWIAAVTAVLLPGAETSTVLLADTRFAAVLATVCGGLTLLCLLWFRGTQMWWTVLTAALVLQPHLSSTVSRAAHRVGGTVLGATISAAAAAIAPTAALVWMGLLAACACAVLSVCRAPYWTFTTAVTAAVLTLSFTGSQMLAADLERLLCTVCAAVASVAAWAAWPTWMRRAQKRH